MPQQPFPGPANAVVGIEESIGPNAPTKPSVPAENVPAAQITFTDVPITDQGASWQNVGVVGSMFEDYRIRNRYERDGHVYMLGITSPNGFQGQSVAFVQTANPTTLWLADWTVQKVADQPEIPNPNVSDPSWVLMDVIYEPATRFVKADGSTYGWRISGIYVYGKTNPSKANPIFDVMYPQPPYLVDQSGRTISVAKLVNGVIDAKQGVGNLGQFPAGGQ